MWFPDPLLRGRLIRRYKRFLADIELDLVPDKVGGNDGTSATSHEVTAHCANPGSMMGLAEPGAEVWVSPSNNPNRKLKYTWELVRVGRSLVGVYPGLANKLAGEAISSGRIGELAGYADLQRERKYGANSRIDFLLTDPEKGSAYVEVKSVSLRRPPGEIAEFPDAVTTRGTKHLNELTRVVADGHRAVMLYVTQRSDCSTFKVAADIDPKYASALAAARRAGVEAYCYDCKVTRSGIDIARRLPISA
jgi:sugar fermentation stimulation protein A